MGVVFLVSLALAVMLSFAFPASAERNRIVTGDVDYRTSGAFNFGALGVILILIALYAIWW
jgi:SSS family solute:Na+ symporter